MATVGQQPTKVVISAPASTPLTGIEILSTSVPFPTVTITELGLGTLAGSVFYAGDPQWGIVGDGVADDAPAINTMSAAAVAAGATKIVFPSGKTFRAISAPIFPRQNLIWDGQGSTFITGVGFPTITGLIFNPAQNNLTFIGNVTGTGVTAPTDQLTLSSVAGLAVGNWIGVRLGNDPYDNVEPYYSFVAQITAINTGTKTITFDWVIDQTVNFGAYNYVQKDPNSFAHNGGPVAVPTVTLNSGLICNAAVYLLSADFALNLTFRDMVLVGDPNGNIGGGIYLQWGANLRFENIVGNPSSTPADMGSGLIVLQFCRNARIDKAYLGYNANTDHNPSHGGMLSFASCLDVVDTNHFSKNLYQDVAFSENYCDKITFVNPVDVVNKDTAGPTFGGYAFHNRAYGELINPTVFSDILATNTSFIWLDTINADGDYRVTGTFKWRGPMAYVVAHAVNKLNCIFDYDDPTVGFARIDFASKNTYKQRIPLIPNMTGAVSYAIPGGVSDFDIMASSGVTVATITALAVQYINNVGSPVTFDISAKLVAGQVVNVGGAFPVSGATVLGSLRGGMAEWTNQVTTIFVGTSATAQADGNFIGIIARVPRVLESNIGIFGGNSSFNSYSLTDDQMCALLQGTPQRIVENGLLVASLPAAAAANKGERRIVTDANATTFATIVAGTGGNTVPVYSDGTNWRIG